MQVFDHPQKQQLVFRKSRWTAYFFIFKLGLTHEVTDLMPLPRVNRFDQNSTALGTPANEAGS
jgi:hypothetical protein